MRLQLMICCITRYDGDFAFALDGMINCETKAAISFNLVIGRIVKVRKVSDFHWAPLLLGRPKDCDMRLPVTWPTSCSDRSGKLDCTFRVVLSHLLMSSARVRGRSVMMIPFEILVIDEFANWWERLHRSVGMRRRNLLRPGRARRRWKLRGTYGSFPRSGVKTVVMELP